MILFNNRSITSDKDEYKYGYELDNKFITINTYFPEYLGPFDFNENWDILEKV